MAKSYPKKRVYRGQNNQSGRFLGLFVSFIMGYLTASVFDATSLSAWVSQHMSTQVAKQSNKMTQAPAITLPKPKLEFYTLLARDNQMPEARQLQPQPPIKTIKPPSIAMPTPTNQHILQAQNWLQTPGSAINHIDIKSIAKPLNKELVKENYIIQIASFNKRLDAERLKASLVLKGFDVNIAAILANHGQWFRVTLGPFNSRQAAEKAQVDVARNEHIKGMIRKMDA